MSLIGHQNQPEIPESRLCHGYTIFPFLFSHLTPRGSFVLSKIHKISFDDNFFDFTCRFYNKKNCIVHNSGIKINTIFFCYVPVTCIIYKIIPFVKLNKILF